MSSKVTISGTIPVAQFANISPTFEVEASTFDEAMDLGLSQLKSVWDRVGREPLDIDREAPEPPPVNKNVKTLTCWASGTKVEFDPVAHVYGNVEGKKWLGGSTFAHRFAGEFPSESASAQVARKWGVDAAEIRAMWKLNSEASTTLGTAVHAALELRQRYGELSAKVKEGSYEASLSSNPVLRPIVEAFFTEERAAEDALAEIFCADAKRHHCGQIDRVVNLSGDWTRVRLEDHKTSKDLFKSESIKEPFKGIVPNNQLGLYTLQINFYRRILESHGKIVEELRVNHWTGTEWQFHDLELLDLDEIMKAAK